MGLTGRLTASVVAMAVLLAIGTVAAFAEAPEQEPSDSQRFAEVSSHRNPGFRKYHPRHTGVLGWNPTGGVAQPS